MTDAELIEAYSSRQDEDAFGELMRRHGAMVYRACHRLLKDAHEAEDASQAVFVVLARKAGGLRKGDLAAWLYRVAHLVAAETVRKRMHRAKREESYAMDEAIQTDAFAASDVADPALLGLVDAALLSLPERYREAVILRYLQNHSEAEAAQRAGCAVGTLSMRASRGIERLRQRLAKRGVALSSVALAGLLTSEASAAVPETLLPSILAVVKTAAATTATATGLPGVALGAKTGASTTAAMLAKGAMKAMFIAKVKMVAAVAAAVVVTGTAVPVGIAVAQAASKEGKEGIATAAEKTVVRSESTADAHPLYMVINLSGVAGAASYPVTSYATSNSVPGGVNSDAYKTTNLLMRLIPKGSFTMGSPKDELGRGLDSGETQHSVTLTHDFYIGVFEITQRQWELVMGNRPSYFNNAKYYKMRPVEQVSYYDIRETPENSDDPTVDWPANSAVNAVSFMGKLRAKTGLTTFDLPTEAQWEYACRAGTTTALNNGKNLGNGYYDANMAEVGRYLENCEGGNTQNVDTSGGTDKVGSYLPNAYGLYDMHGNVCEWCLDWYGTYPGTVSDPGGVASGSQRVFRGGSYYYWAGDCRSAFRDISPNYTLNSIGFRAAMTLP